MIGRKTERIDVIIIEINTLDVIHKGNCSDNTSELCKEEDVTVHTKGPRSNGIS